MGANPEEWERLSLAAVAARTPNSFVDGPFGSNLKTSEYSARGVRLIQLQNIGDGFWVDTNQKFIPPRKFAELARHAAYPGDIAIAKMAEPVARACLIPAVEERFVVVADCIKLTPDASRHDPRYLVYALNHTDIRAQAERKSTGTTRQRINLSTLKTLQIRTPPLSEQRGIADILNTVDGAIQQTEGLIDKLKQMRADLLHDLLTRGLDEHGRLRDPVTHPEQFKDSRVGRIPNGWEVSPLEKKKSQSRPYIKTGPFGSSLKGEDWVEDGVPVITIGSIGEGEFIRSELLFISESKARSLAACAVEPGDLVFSRVADVGRSVVVGEGQRGWIMSSNLMRIALDPALVVPAFVHLNLVHNESTRSQIRRFVNAGGREVANTAVLNSLLFAWPAPHEQLRAAAIIATHDARVRSEVAYRDKLKLLKQGLMHDLLTGVVRAAVLETRNDEQRS